MKVYAFEAVGFRGQLVTVEVDIRRGIPAVDIVGLPDGAVKESRERVRAAVRNSGYDFPMDRILVNLAPAGIRKAGAGFDLPIALAILHASGQIPDPGSDILALGELELSGTVRNSPGVLPAVAAGLAAGLESFIVPPANVNEARVLAGAQAWPLARLADAAGTLAELRDGLEPCHDCGDHGGTGQSKAETVPDMDISVIRGQGKVRRALELAAAGGHHLLLFGPPGGGKTLAARCLPSLLSDMGDDEAIEATALHSLAGALPPGSGLMRRPPFRAPHHSASAEGIVGGGKAHRPGEISLAHGGILFLDEAPEFKTDVLQALREPMETRTITIARADRSASYPACFILVVACNPCPCGNLGRPGAVCLCSREEIRRYWRRLGGPFLDRIDLRVPVVPAGMADLATPQGEGSLRVRKRVRDARAIQRQRHRGMPWSLNAHMSVGSIERHCSLDPDTAGWFSQTATTMGLSSRALHGVLKVARTAADLDASAGIHAAHLAEALDYRRYGDEDLYWQTP